MLLKLLNFNSIKVRLEPTSPFANEKVTTFQFHKGAIRTLFRGISIPVTDQFQFHKGAIRTYRCTPVLDYAHIFQFHKGAIRTKFSRFKV